MRQQFTEEQLRDAPAFDAIDREVTRQLANALAQPQEPISADKTVPGSLSDTHDGTHPHNTKEGPTA